MRLHTLFLPAKQARECRIVSKVWIGVVETFLDASWISSLIPFSLISSASAISSSSAFFFGCSTPEYVVVTMLELGQQIALQPDPKPDSLRLGR